MVVFFFENEFKFKTNFNSENRYSPAPGVGGFSVRLFLYVFSPLTPESGELSAGLRLWFDL